MRTLIVIMALLCAGCAAKPEPKSWIEIEMQKPEYGEKLSEGVKMLFSNPQAFEHIELLIMEMSWKREDEKLKGAANDDRAEVQDREQ